MINFELFRSPNFVPHLKNIRGGIKGCCQKEKWENCAAASVELLTGIPATETDKVIKDLKIGWHTKPMIKYLEKHGYTAIELTDKNLLKHPKQVNWHYHFPVMNEHVLMIGAWVDSVDSSQFVLHNRVLYHHCHVEPNYNHLYFLNKVVSDVVLVWHPKWA